MTIHRKTTLACVLGGLFAAFAQGVQSHALWDPQGLIKPRSNRDDIKAGPCGVPRTNTAVTLAAGSTVNLEIERTIYHQGYFRIAFSPANDQGFDNYVLANNIAESSSQRHYSVSVTLPDMECDACTLQLIQVMLDRNPPTNYYSCADIKLVRDAEPDDTQPPGGVTQVLAVPGDRSVQLSWTNPADADFAGVVIAESAGPSAATPTHGKIYQSGDLLGASTVVFAGNANSAVFSNRNAGDYHYTLFAFDQSHNYGPGVSTEVTLVDAVPNLAPSVNLVAEQDQQTVTQIKVAAGLVTVQALISDANNADTHALTWSTSDTRLVDLYQVEEQFTFDPAGLPPGDYRVGVEVVDSGEPPLSDVGEITLTVAGSNPSPGGGANNAWLLLMLSGLLVLRRDNNKQNSLSA